MDEHGLEGPTSSAEPRCPHCGAHAKPPAAGSARGAGEVVDCEACDRSFVMPDPGPAGRAADASETAPPALRLLPEFERGSDLGAGGARWFADVGLLPTAGIGLALTALFYAVLVAPLRGFYFGELFLDRGWVPYVIAFLAAWSGALLVAKYLRLGRATRALRLDLLPRDRAPTITPGNVEKFLEGLGELPDEYEGNPLIDRIRLGLEHFRARSRVSETVEQLQILAQNDEARLESGFAMLRVFIWAIPILGFIGTVMGIGASVGGFSESVASAPNLEIMKDSIGSVTSGLGIAFDTTLLALVVSIFIMFPTSSLQRSEESFLADIDGYCRRHLLGRLDDAEHAQTPDSAIERLADALYERLRARERESG